MRRPAGRSPWPASDRLSCERPKSSEMRVTFKLTAVAAVAALAFVGIPSAAEATKVRIGVVNASSDVAVYIAESKGFFAAEGIEPEYVFFKSATDMKNTYSGWINRKSTRLTSSHIPLHRM